MARVQQPAPDFEATAVVNGEFKTIKLSDYKGKYVVLFFYPFEASPETQALDGGLFCERGFSWYQEARSLVIARFVWSVAA